MLTAMSDPQSPHSQRVADSFSHSRYAWRFVLNASRLWECWHSIPRMSQSHVRAVIVTLLIVHAPIAKASGRVYSPARVIPYYHHLIVLTACQASPNLSVLNSSVGLYHGPRRGFQYITSVLAGGLYPDGIDSSLGGRAFHSIGRPLGRLTSCQACSALMPWCISSSI